MRPVIIIEASPETVVFRRGAREVRLAPVLFVENGTNVVRSIGTTPESNDDCYPIRLFEHDAGALLLQRFILEGIRQVMGLPLFLRPHVRLRTSKSLERLLYDAILGAGAARITVIEEGEITQWPRHRAP